MIGTLDTSTDIKWQEQELWILLKPTIGYDWGSGYFVDLYWQLQELWKLVLFSTGNEKDF